MPGSKHRRKKKLSRSENSTGPTGNVPREATPKLPTSGQIMGVLVRSLGITHPNLRDKTAQRYFSGRLENRVRESSRDKIIAAISETLASSVFVATPVRENEERSDSSWLAGVLDWHAVNWDRFRAFLQPRMMRVYPNHWAQVWRAYVRLAAIDLHCGQPPMSTSPGHPLTPWNSWTGPPWAAVESISTVSAARLESPSMPWPSLPA